MDELVPYFRKHCELSETEAAALSEVMGLYDAAAGNPPEADAPRIAYLDSLVEYCQRSRAVLNNTGLEGLSELYRPVAAAEKNKHVQVGKPSVIDQIRAAQKAPKQPREQKPERDKKKSDPEL